MAGEKRLGRRAETKGRSSDWYERTKVWYRRSGTRQRGTHVNVWREKAALIVKDARWLVCGGVICEQWRNFEIYNVASLAMLDQWTNCGDSLHDHSRNPL